MKRRDFLIGAGAAGLAATALRGARATSPEPRRPHRLLALYVTGGWDTTYAIDPKEPDLVDVPAGTRQLFGGLDVFTDPSRPSVTRFFEQFAGSTAIVRGIATDGLFHNECQQRMATGKREASQPDLGAMIAHDIANDLPIPYLILGDVAFTGPYAASAARLGTTNQIVDLLAPPPSDPRAASNGDPGAPLPDPNGLLDRYAQASVERARATRGATGYNRRRVDDFADAITRSERLRTLRDKLGKRGETLSFASQIPLALDAIQQDVSHSVMLTTRLGWDTHSNNAAQNNLHEVTFAGLCDLVAGMIARPGRSAGTRMIDDTLLIVFSEMSRTPRLNGAAGKDHWPLTSAFLVGAGVRGGAVFGATTPAFGGMTVDLATGAPSPTGVQPMYSHFIAGVLTACGADPAVHFPGIPVFDAFVA